MAKKKSKRVARKVPKPNRRAAKAQIDYLQIASYEEVLVKGIVTGRQEKKSTEYSLLFNSVLSTLTPGMRNLYYKSGISVGRILYTTCEQNTHYTWYEESVKDLVSFFEKSGFSRITYNIFPDRLDIKLHKMDPTFLGSSMHVFESGIISGFLSAGRLQHVKVDEIACCNNGSKFCHFITTENLPLYLGADTREVFDRFVENIIPHDPENRYMFADAYAMLSSSVFLDREYLEHMKNIVRHMGIEVGLGISLDKKLSGKSVKAIERISNLLGFGSLSIRSPKPLDMQFRFDKLKAKKEFVDISIAFLNGMLSNSVGKESSIDTRVTHSKNSYIVRIVESRK